MNFEQLESFYNTYMDESEAYASSIWSDFVMTPPSFEEMKEIIGRTERRDHSMRGLRDQSGTIIRHQYSHYDVMLRDLPAPACEHRFKYLVMKAITICCNAQYR
jgi:hypothetical protein